VKKFILVPVRVFEIVLFAATGGMPDAGMRRGHWPAASHAAEKDEGRRGSVRISGENSRNAAGA
jgi:hypothetical protein